MISFSGDGRGRPRLLLPPLPPRLALGLRKEELRDLGLRLVPRLGHETQDEQEANEAEIQSI